jgi:hypothetical protein
VRRTRKPKKSAVTAKAMLHPLVRAALDVPAGVDDKTFLKDWRMAARRVCKPCWELRYCPYGPLVEEFPLLPPIRSDAVHHNQYLRDCLHSGKLSDGTPLDADRRKMFKSDIAHFDPNDYPEDIPSEISMMSCSVFGHICPVVFASEVFTETTTLRRSGRYIPFRTKIRVVRRDNYTCQHCGKHLLDNEVEFDHKIPISRGGSSDEHNLRLTCHDCNQDKSDRVEI